ncbi:MAG: glycosyltransferase family 39 protein [Chloroflexi bacterium]|nr:glycosyltransferase family 39 protein [Chloroflexota bacterium]
MQLDTIVGVVLALPLILYLPGAVVCRLALGQGLKLWDGEFVERVFVRVFVSILISGWTAFVLAELGVYSIQLLWSLLMGLFLICTGILWRREHGHLGLHLSLRMPRWYEAALAVELLVAAALFFHPAEMIRGDLDSGVYVNTGASIARTGGIITKDPQLAALNPDEEKQLLLGLLPGRFTLQEWRIPGFYVLDKQAGLVLPQLYHLLPAWIAIWISALGLQAGLQVMPFILLLSTAGVYVAGKRLFGNWVALIATLFLLLNSAQIWFARYPTSEGLNQLLFWGMVFAFVLFIEALRKENGPQARFFGVVAGASMGQIMMVRPDFIFFILPAIAYALYLRLSRRWQTAHWYFFAPLGLMGVHAGLHLAFFTYPYTVDLYHHIIRYMLETWPVWEIPLGVISLVLLVILDRKTGIVRFVERQIKANLNLITIALSVVLVVFVGYAYLIRPGIISAGLLRNLSLAPGILAGYIGAPVPRGSSANMVRLGWYLSPLGILLSTAGMALWIRRRLDGTTLLLLTMSGIYLFIYVNETYTVQYYIYTMRRYIPVVLPALSLTAALALVEFARVKKWRPIAIGTSAVLTIVMIAFFVYTGRVIVPHVEYRGLIDQIGALSSQFKKGDILLFSERRDEPYVVATPLEYVYGLDVFSLRLDQPDNSVVESMIQRWQSEGHNVFIIAGTNGGKLALKDMELHEIGEWTMDVPEFEQQFDQKPMNTYSSELHFGIYKPEPAPATGTKPSDTVRIDIGGFDYQYLVSGFYEKESDPSGTVFRWTGPDAQIRIASGWNGPGYLTLRASAGPQQRDKAASVTVAVNGVPIGKLDITSGFNTYRMEVPTKALAAGRDELTISLHSSTWSPSDSGLGYDSRSLGIELDSIGLEK